MARIVPGSGAVIKPFFNETFGVKYVKVLDGGEGYESDNPPRLTVTGCGTPVEEALLYPIIDDESGKIIHVRVLVSGRGYDPLRVSILPEEDTLDISNSFSVQRIWQSTPNSLTRSNYLLNGQIVTNYIRVESDNHPKPADIPGERNPGGGDLVHTNYDHTFIYRGGKDVPNFGAREFQLDKTLGILSNGSLLHTPEWGPDGGAPAGYSIDTVKYNFIKTQDEYDGVFEGNQYYYQSSRFIEQWSKKNSVFENGYLRPVTWDIKVEYDNVLLIISDTNEDNGTIDVGRTLSSIVGNGRGEIAKVVRNQGGFVTRIYLRNVTNSFVNGENLLGSNGFTARVSQNPILFTNGIFYLNFRDEAEEFGPFINNTWYFAPQNIRVPANYLIIWNQIDPSNQPSEMHSGGHPMQFSTTPDGPLNQNPGVLYLNVNDQVNSPAADYENEFQPLLIMNSSETRRIYYYCKYHNHMSGYTGDEGYIELGDPDNIPPLNDYYITDYYTGGNTIDYSRHVTGHSKILGISYDGYPIYGPYGYDDSKNVIRQTSSYRLKVGDEIESTRPRVTTTGTVTYTVTILDGKFYIDGNLPPFLEIDRGKTYIFNQDDASNDDQFLLFSEQEEGWHIGVPPEIGNTSYLYQDNVTYYLDGQEVPYSSYVSLFNTSTQREVRITPRVDSPSLFYTQAYATIGHGFRVVCGGYLLGDLTQDYIYDETLGTLDEFNGKFSVTPEYPNGTYAYFMTEDSNGDPIYPYAIGPKFYGVPYFVDAELPEFQQEYPSGAFAEVFLNDAGAVDYIRMKSYGDNYFGRSKAKILGGEGSGATCTPIVQTVTGLSLLNPGKSFATPPTVVIEGGGGGNGARGSAQISTTGTVTSINVVDGGDFYQQAPYVLITGGGGLGAKAVAVVDQGQIVGINITDPGRGYTSPPNIIFTKLVNLKRRVSARQSLNSENYFVAGLSKSIDADDSTIYVDSTDSFPGSGEFMMNNEIVTYTSKSRERFLGVTRGTNLRYDQRVILDSTQVDQNNISTYEYNVFDTIIRKIDNKNNKLAKVYDWNPTTKELLVTFEVDELAFIDGGIPSTEDRIVQFDAGVADSSGSGVLPHTVFTLEGATIVRLTNPISVLNNASFEDDDELEGLGDGIPDLINTGTAYDNQINLDGGLHNTLYGIEETLGGQNTTLFQVGDQIKDASIPFKFATIVGAGQLNEGQPQEAYLDIYVDANFGNGQNFFVNETITGSISSITATVVSWDIQSGVIRVKDITPFNTGNINIGVNGYFYNFSTNGTIVDFIVQDQGIDYSDVPTLDIEAISDLEAQVTVNMTAAGDQIESVSIDNGGYGYKANIDPLGNYHPTVDVVNAVGDTSGSGGVVQAVLGGENILGNSGASYRIKRIEYVTQIRSL